MFTDEQFSRLAALHMDAIFRIALSYTKSRADADDITQNTLIKLYRADKSFDSQAHIKHWLIRVSINESKKALLSPWRRLEPLEEMLPAFSLPSREHSELFCAVMNLPRKYRTAILLYYYEDYSTDEISKILSIPKATICTHLKRGREKLKITLSEAKNHA